MSQRHTGSTPGAQLRRIILLLSACFAIGAVGFALIEDLSPLQSIYLTMATMTTVGYGDIYPVTRAGQWFSMAVMLSGVSIGFYAVGLLAALLVEGRLGQMVEERRMRKQIDALANHFIICGLGEVGIRLADELERAGAEFVVVERDPERVQVAKDRGYLVVEGEATDEAVLAQARVTVARGLATVISDDAENLYITVSSRAMNPQMTIVARGTRRRGGRYLAQSGANNVVYLDDLGAARMARSLLHPEVIGFLEEMMSPERGGTQLDVLKIPADCRLTGQSLKDINLRARLGIQVLAIRREGRYLGSPGPEETLRAEDVLLVVGSRESLSRLEREMEPEATASS